MRPERWLPVLLMAMAMPALAQGGTSGKGDRPSGQMELRTPTSAYDARTDAQPVDPRRFGERYDQAFGAYQRGLYMTALNLARPRAENGDAAAQTLMAEILSRGLGVPRDAKAAAEWYRKAAQQDVPAAQFQYALMLADGDFIPRDMKEAYRLMQLAADRGNPLAQFNLAQMIAARETGEASLRRAVDYYEKAANAGVPDAQYAMAQVLAQGIGGRAKDEAAAREWLLRAAHANFDTAQIDFATWLVEGRGGERDLESGFNWMMRAAAGGNVAARARLAKLYIAGIGNEGNPVEAASWYLLARRAGLVDGQLEDFLDGLTENQLAEARDRIAQLR